MRPVSRQRRLRQKGQAMLEGALSLSALLIMFIATIELGRYILFIEYFTERARAGARYSATVAYDADTIKNWICYNTATAPTTVNGGQSAGGHFGLTPSMITVNRYDPDTDIDRLEVSINNYPLTLFIPILPQQWTLRPFKVVIPAESLGATN